ncbi:MAG: hypothetical protein HQL41_06280, partial [Alphaproteobacteria bacterium]|nr:hypothetical protein [Alphaproteobacteria bacterium]
VEVPPKQAERMGADFIHRQTIASSVRYTTVELGELENRIRGGADKALALELDLFADLVGEAVARADEIARAAQALAALDVASSLAELAIERRWCRPSVDDGPGFAIRGGRHPVVEAASVEPFVANDCDLSDGQRLWLVTGPNMAGKSTFLRQNALIAVLAQMGSFVPADGAALGVVDRLFSRVGAADDLARGRSTFMVEMVETAAILNQAGPRSLVILDEIGRGTATWDGMSIAWAVVEHLHAVNQARVSWFSSWWWARDWRCCPRGRCCKGWRRCGLIGCSRCSPGCGSSICSISWTASTASPGSRRWRSAAASPRSPWLPAATRLRRRCWPGRRWAFCAGTGRRPACFWGMWAACRWASCWAGCCCPPPRGGSGRRP